MMCKAYNERGKGRSEIRQMNRIGAAGCQAFSTGLDMIHFRLEFLLYLFSVCNHENCGGVAGESRNYGTPDSWCVSF
jgi:hypothetical protein